MLLFKRSTQTIGDSLKIAKNGLGISSQFYGTLNTMLPCIRFGVKSGFYLMALWGAPCSVHLKREVLDIHCLDTDTHVFGYTYDERERVERWTKSNGEKVGLFPLVDAQLTHADCLSLVERAGIELPAMYKLGYNNANCVGCCKGGEGYWNKIKIDFPEVFNQVVQIQESIGPGAYTFRNRKTGERFGLKDLNPEAGRHKVELPSCSFICEEVDDELQGF